MPTTQPTATLPYLQLHLAVLLFGAAGLFGKLILLSPLLIVLGRTVWASVFLGILVSWEAPWRLSQKVWKMGALLGAILAFHWVAFYQSIQLSTVAVGVLTFSTFPVFTVLLAALLLKDPIRLKEFGLAVLAFAGVALLLIDIDLSANYFWGVIWGVASGASFAVLALLNKKWIKEFSANQMALLQNAGATLWLLPFAFFIPWSSRPLDYLWLALLGIVFTGISHSLFIKSLHHISAQVASIVAALEPVYAMLLALVLLWEVPSSMELIGGALILLAAVWAMYKPKKR